MTLSETDITAELILRAFEVTGLRPEEGFCYARDGRAEEETLPAGPCGCALGALALAFEVLDPSSRMVQTDIAISALGLSAKQGWEIALGFDGGMRGSQPTNADPLYVAGCDAGRVLRERAVVAQQ